MPTRPLSSGRAVASALDPVQPSARALPRQFEASVRLERNPTAGSTAKTHVVGAA